MDQHVENTEQPSKSPEQNDLSDLENQDIAWKTAEKCQNNLDLENLANMEINDVNTATEILKKNRKNTDFSKRKPYEIINAAKQIQKEAQNLRRFEQRNGKFEVSTNDPESILKKMSYREAWGEIILQVNNLPEVHLKTTFSSWSEIFDRQLDPWLKKILDARAYAHSLSQISHLFREWKGWREDKADAFSQIQKELEAKIYDQWKKIDMKEYMKVPWNMQKMIDAFKGVPLSDLNGEWFFEIKRDLTECLRNMADFTFTQRDFSKSSRVSFDHSQKTVQFCKEEIFTCNAKITGVDDEGIHLLNSVTGESTVFRADTLQKSEKVQEERKEKWQYVDTKVKEIRNSLGFSDEVDLTREDRAKAEKEFVKTAIMKDETLFNILFEHAEINKKFWSYHDRYFRSEGMALFLQELNIPLKKGKNYNFDFVNLNGEKTVKIDSWDTQIFLQFWKQPRIEHHKVSQEELKQPLPEKEKSPQYKRALQKIEAEKDTWKIDLQDLWLSSQEVWNLFAETNLQDQQGLEINLSRNRITTIPRILLQQKNIKTLNLDSNIISEMDQDLFENLQKDQCNIENLSLCGNNLEKLPWVLFQYLNKLQNLDLCGSKIKEIPDTIWNLKNLKSLNLSCTEIEHIPDSFSNCKELESFSMSWTKIKEIPDSLTELTNLKALSMSNTELTSLPDLSWLTHLEEISLWNSKLTTFPNLSFKNLKYLDISQCKQMTPWEVRIKEQLNKHFPQLKVQIETKQKPFVLSGEMVKDRYFSYHSENKTLSWDPNQFFDDTKKYAETWVIANTTEEWLKQAQNIFDTSDLKTYFYVERKMSDGKVAMEVFVEDE